MLKVELVVARGAGVVLEDFRKSGINALESRWVRLNLSVVVGMGVTTLDVSMGLKTMSWGLTPVNSDEADRV
jgi:hypothetical protein